MHLSPTRLTGRCQARCLLPGIEKIGDACAGAADHGGKRPCARLRGIEDYTSKYKGEQVEVAMFGGDYHEGVLTAYCAVDEVPHIELNGHILIPLQNIASLHCTSRCDAPEPDWPPRGLTEDERDT